MAHLNRLRENTRAKQSRSFLSEFDSSLFKVFKVFLSTRLVDGRGQKDLETSQTWPFKVESEIEVDSWYTMSHKAFNTIQGVCCIDTPGTWVYQAEN